MRRMRPPLAVLLVTSFVALALACAGPKPKAKAKLTPRAEFKAQLVGKDREEVKALLGPPRSTKPFKGTDAWAYDGLTFDPESGKPDRSVTLWFRKSDRVDDVFFHP